MPLIFYLFMPCVKSLGRRILKKPCFLKINKDRFYRTRSLLFDLDPIHPSMSVMDLYLTGVGLFYPHNMGSAASTDNGGVSLSEEQAVSKYR